MKHKYHSERTLFLKEFVRQLLMNKARELVQEGVRELPFNPQALEEKPQEVKVEEISAQNEMAPSLDSNALGVSYTPRATEPAPVPSDLSPSSQEGYSLEESTDYQASLSSGETPSETSAEPVPAVAAINAWEELVNLLADPSVETVECTGPDTQLVIRKNNEIQYASLTLTKEEVDQILMQLSQETKAPFVEGVLSAQTPFYMITAVSSEIAGSRFMVQKV